MSPRRRAGRRNRATPHAGRGTAWEQLLELHHARMLAQGVAVVFRTPPPVRLLEPRPGGKWLAVLTAEGPPDYTGTLRVDGVAVPLACEAKDCASARWGLDMLQPHQAQALRAWDAAGGLAVVVLRHQPSRSCWVLPWWTLGPVWTRWRAGQVAGRKAPRGSASLSAGQLATMGWRWAEGQGPLEALRAAWRARGQTPTP